MASLILKYERLHAQSGRPLAVKQRTSSVKQQVRSSDECFILFTAQFYKKHSKCLGSVKQNFAFIPDEEGKKHGAIVNRYSSFPYVLENVSQLFFCNPKVKKSYLKHHKRLI